MVTANKKYFENSIDFFIYFCYYNYAFFLESKCGSSSVDRAMPCQGIGRGFEPRLPLQRLLKSLKNSTILIDFAYISYIWRHSQVVRHESAKL